MRLSAGNRSYTFLKICKNIHISIVLAQIFPPTLRCNFSAKPFLVYCCSVLASMRQRRSFRLLQPPRRPPLRSLPVCRAPRRVRHRPDSFRDKPVTPPAVRKVPPVPRNREPAEQPAPPALRNRAVTNREPGAKPGRPGKTARQAPTRTGSKPLPTEAARMQPSNPWTTRMRIN